MLDYDKEADAYDATRGGEPRAAAAADAVLGLIPSGTRRLLDVACGTGIVTRRLAAARPATRVTGADLSYGMARTAAVRLPGAVVLADSRALPFPGGVFDAVTSVWLLHLLDRPEDVRTVIAECARVLRPGGVWVTTVDKAAAHDVGSDIDAVLAPRPRRPAPDAAPLVESCAAAHHLRPAGRARFPGRGQGRSPRRTAADLRRGWFTLLPPGDPLTAEFAARLEALPDQELPRPDPVFSVLAFRKAD
ncbi:SAM-dependent methyltransferase [Streptomyces sp. SAI-135]|uniref:class I SAM-dependent methyltransferase n=1 Tax=unclassified Streptomyces TaxID=2593676 RepID=UPI00247444A8|nr:MULTISPECIES: class I SAM-dependent methyltransferase [unclassified Streptomyces]MDH6515421.1 SAM-dependent methyltransferase [Streptomyces sp. SAI-090]MDH6566719.1 SAM-dependent methyltransferase [Streptomyces sp. SAI-117]MDH6588342.1 SAM-dependent methyltransferase [Streptomyces sp. SAI-133]MDH6620492.1 SAM-dependent methyltransferase [Streptomyces sp. SAI-135]